MERKNPKCSQYDLRALEAWLAEMAADGWALAGEWPYFEKTEEPQERRFAIEPAAEKDGVPKALLDSRATMGWEYVCAIDKGALSWQNTPIKSLGISRIFGAVQTEKTPPGRARGFVQRFPRH